MDVPHRRAGGLLGERLRLGVFELAEEALEVERIGAHAFRHLPLPHRARTVGVDLDAVLVRIAEVDRLADEVVGGAREADALAHGMRKPARETAPIGEQQREVEQARAAGRRLRARLLDELEQARVADAERRPAVVLRQHRQADRAAVVVERASEIGHRQMHRAHARGIRDRAHAATFGRSQLASASRSPCTSPWPVAWRTSSTSAPPATSNSASSITCATEL